MTLHLLLGTRRVRRCNRSAEGCLTENVSSMWSSYSGCMVDASASRGEEGRGRLRKASGSRQTGFDPEISEWGNPSSLGNQMASRMDEFIVHDELTQGTETSQYLEERKSTETP